MNYNNREYSEALGINIYEMDVRQYDPAIARWTVIDPVTHHSLSPYNAFDNNPVYWADPSGADAYDTAIAMFNATPDGYNSEWTNQGDGSFMSTTGVLFDVNSFSFFSGFEISGNTNFSNGGSGSSKAENLSNITIDAIRTRWGLSLAELGWRINGHVYSQGEYYADYRSNRRWQAAHDILDLFGYVPAIGEVFDGVNGGLYAYRGDYVNAGLSFGAMIPIGGYFANGAKIVKKNVGNTIDATKVLSGSEILRIQNAATRINKPITVVGSRASGTANAYSDWDYVIPDLNSKNWSKIKNSLPGARSTMDNTARNIDIFKGPVHTNMPHVTINPR